MPHDLHAELAAVARARDRPVAREIRAAIRAYIDGADTTEHTRAA